MNAELLFSAISVLIAGMALGLTTYLLSRQVQQMEHERNALAILDAINRLTDPVVMRVFDHLEDCDERYRSDEDVLTQFHGSEDERAFTLVGQYVETVACLARRRVLDASLIVDAVGLMLRTRWSTVRPLVERLRRVRSNAYIFENFEWLAMYSAWWKDTPRPRNDPYYDEKQFAGLKFRV